MANAPKNIHKLSLEAFEKRLNYMVEKTNDFLPIADTLKIQFAEGNRKTKELVPSVSLRPVLDCKNCGKCGRLCYDLRNDCWHSAVMDGRSRNYAIFQNNPKRYFDEISEFCKRKIAFRWHIGGDIVNMEYLKGMVRVARENKQCHFLVFTKMFDLVNEYLDKHSKPKNLQILFSGWVGLEMNNPHNLPTAHPIFADGSTTADNGAYLCKGDCTHCLLYKEGCWNLKKGEQVVFYAH